MSEEEKAEHENEYQTMLALFVALLRAMNTDAEEEALYELAEQRTQIAVNKVLNGLGVDYETAIQLLQNADDNNLTQHDKDLRDRIDAAISNLIDFSVCEEYQLYDEVSEIIGQDPLDMDIDDYGDLLYLCEKYNNLYAMVENADIAYAGAMAAWWLKLSAADWVVYWTQNDSRVRPWHMALQGYAAPRDEFPSWMIPPIEYNCRCFLETIEYGSAIGKLKAPISSTRRIQKPKQLSDVYSESLAKCGRIFGPTHNYFIINKKDKEMLLHFVERLKEKYYGQKKY